MLNLLKSFYRDPDGAVTTDWVVLTAGIVILATAVGVSVRDGTIVGGQNIADNIATHITP